MLTDKSGTVPFNLERRNDLSHVKEALERSGYTKAALVEVNRGRKFGDKLDVCLIERRISTPSPLHTLIALFFLGRSVPIDAIASAVGKSITEQLLDIGVLRRTDDGIRSAALLMPENDILVAHDFPIEVTGRPLAADYVLGVGRASQTLANMTVRRQNELVLDIGTGSGIQALLAAKHAARVIGTDVNTRALNFAALNARLNGISSLELRQGGLYQPVGQETVDLIVANPPFVISPASRYVYRDSALPGDTISQQVITGAAPRLHDGGFCIVLFNWYHENERDLFERPRQWIESNGCDAWLICLGSEDPLSYAAGWLRPAAGTEESNYGPELDEWVKYYCEMGIGRISSGVLVLRRRSAQRHWLRTDALPLELQNGSCSEQILRIFDAQDVLEALGDAKELLQVKFRLANDHEMEHHLHIENRNWQVIEAHLKLNAGLCFSGPVDRFMSTLVAGFDGHSSLGELIHHLADGLKLDITAITPSCLSAVRTLMQSGFLIATNFPGRNSP
jgi:SAM-dependent methyltransferase